ncbi:MAG TPA: RDD family protein [Acetivibrio sp.]|nr:RDD family protein [Acetivibrio sp.]
MSLFDGESDWKDRLNIAQAKPWVRFWARTVDLYIVDVIIKAIQLILFQGKLFNPLLLGFGSSLIWAFAEANSIYTWGTTPGKWLLRTEVRANNLKKPDLFASIKRSILVWLLGVGMGVFSSFTYIAGYYLLTRKGYTLWDKYSDCYVVHKKMSDNRAIVAVFIIIALVIVDFAFSFVNAYFYCKEAGLI